MPSEWVAFIAEEVELDARGPVATGRFSGSLQTEQEIGDAIDDWLSLAEAGRWARERADRVVVRIAGEEPRVETAVDLSRRRRLGVPRPDVRGSTDPLGRDRGG